MSWNRTFQDYSQAETWLGWAMDNSSRNVIGKGAHSFAPRSHNLRGHIVGGAAFVERAGTINPKYMPRYQAAGGASDFLLYEFALFEVAIVRGLQKLGATGNMVGTIALAMLGQTLKKVPSAIGGGMGGAVSDFAGMVDPLAGGGGDMLMRAGTPAAKTFHKRVRLAEKSGERMAIAFEEKLKAPFIRLPGGGMWNRHLQTMAENPADRATSSGFQGEWFMLVSQVTPMRFESTIGGVFCWHQSGVVAAAFNNRWMYDGLRESFADSFDGLREKAFDGYHRASHAFRNGPKEFQAAARGNSFNWFDTPIGGVGDPMDGTGRWLQWLDPSDGLVPAIQKLP